MRNKMPIHLNGRFVAVVLGIAALGVGSLASAVILPGGGAAKSDCYVVLDVTGGQPVGNGKKKVECIDGDPACDADGACNNSVTFEVKACVNQPGIGSCTPPAALSTLTGKKALTTIQAPLTGSACGAILEVAAPVKVKKNGKLKDGKVKGGLSAKVASGRPKGDNDNFVLVSKGRTGVCPEQPTTTTTIPDSATTTSTTSTTSTTVICAAGACCGAEQIVLVSTAGTLQVDALPPFPFPTGVMTTMNVGAPDANCGHDVVVPAGGFFVPVFDLPALNYCSQVVATGCEAGGGVGSGRLWDGHAPTGVALTNVIKRGDSADGVCDTTAITPGTCAGGARDGLPCAQATQCPPTPGSTTAGVCSTAGSGFGNCNTTLTGAGANTLGDIDSVKDGELDLRRAQRDRHPRALDHLVGQPLQPGDHPRLLPRVELQPGRRRPPHHGVRLHPEPDDRCRHRRLPGQERQRLQSRRLGLCRRELQGQRVHWCGHALPALHGAGGRNLRVCPRRLYRRWPPVQLLHGRRDRAHVRPHSQQSHRT